MLVQRCLAFFGKGVVLFVARDGEEALEILSTNSLVRPYVIVTDLNMPGMSGLELIERIRSTADLCNNVIFVLSSSRLEEDIQRSYMFNIAGYICKDTSTQELAASIRTVVSFCKTVHLPH
jgi:DNA-binding NarL/FixJ family response regulator